jgi:hypothetical protein
MQKRPFFEPDYEPEIYELVSWDLCGRVGRRFCFEQPGVRAVPPDGMPRGSTKATRARK